MGPAVLLLCKIIYRVTHKEWDCKDDLTFYGLFNNDLLKKETSLQLKEIRNLGNQRPSFKNLSRGSNFIGPT